jgi:FHA domain
VLKADPATRVCLICYISPIALTIQQVVEIIDKDSMHGTHIGDMRLKNDTPHRIHDGDLILFGAEVSRGEGMQLCRFPSGKLC